MNYKTFLFLITLLTACKSENKSPQQSQQLSDTIYGIDSTSIVKPIEDKIIRNYTIVPKKQFSLEEALEYIQKDEYVEVTPKSIRMRKIYLNANDRKRYDKKDD